MEKFEKTKKKEKHMNEIIRSIGGGSRHAGRPKADGERHTYTVSKDVHAWIMAHGAGQYITDTYRSIMSIYKASSDISGE